MHSEIHLRWANWVEPDFPSRCIWQTRGHDARERTARKGMMRETGVRFGCLRRRSRTSVSQRQQGGCGKGWEPAQWQFSPTLEGRILKSTPILTLLQLSEWQLLPSVAQVRVTGAILGSSFFPSHPVFSLRANPIRLVFKIQNISEHSPPLLTHALFKHHLASPRWLTSLPHQSPTPPSPATWSPQSERYSPSFEAQVRSCHSCAPDPSKAPNPFKIKSSEGPCSDLQDLALTPLHTKQIQKWGC